jgi:hypothetical protein
MDISLIVIGKVYQKKKRLLGSQIKMNNVCIPNQASEASKSILG